MIAQEGFAYLNSENYTKLFEKQRVIEKQLLAFEGINKFMLNNIYKKFYEEQENRENEMLRNIYIYSKEHHYNQAVFFIGSAHRNSIIRKIAEFETKENVALNWTFYSKT